LSVEHSEPVPTRRKLAAGVRLISHTGTP
jgi:hypothetical protein